MNNLDERIKKVARRLLHLSVLGVLAFLLLITVSSVLIGWLYSDVLLVSLLVLIFDVAVLTFYLLINRHSTQVNNLEQKVANLEQHINNKPDTENVEKAIKKNKHEVDDAVRKHTRNLYLQIESFHNMQQKLNFTTPLPSMSGWAASPELALLIADTIEANNYKTIVDLGSGVSSLIAGYSLKHVESGTVFSVDHEDEYYEKTKQLIDNHGLSDTVKLRHAPLKKHDIGNNTYSWYDLNKLQDIEDIDLLIVDGPPGNTQKHARYPAAMLLRDKLSENASIILDDYNREDEKEIVDMWTKELKDLNFTHIESDKGIAVLNKSFKK
jgi:predicted O-methyltransferase YrrM